MIIITAIILTFLLFWYIAYSSSKKNAAQEIERINRVAQREKENARMSAMMMAKNTYYSSSYGSYGSSKNKPTSKTYSPTMKANTNSYSRNRNRNSYTSDDGDSMMIVNSVISSLSNSSYDSPSSSSFSCDTSSSSSSSSSCDSGGSSSSD